MSSDRVWTEEFWRTATVVDLHSELRIFDLKTKDRNNSTLLHFAAEYTNSSLMITTLLAAGADIEAWDRMGRTPLYIAAGYNENPEVLTALIEAGAETNMRSVLWGETPLHYAARNNNADVLRVLLGVRTGVDTDIWDGVGLMPLHYAARCNKDPAAISALVKAGANPNARTSTGATPLHYAAACNENTSLISALLEVGADINARDQIGNTSLHWAAENANEPSILAALLEAGADVNSRSRVQRTLAGRLAFWRNEEDRGLLSALSTFVTLPTKEDGTPLHGAVMSNNTPAIVEFLLDQGADTDAQDADGKRPGDYAEGNRNLSGTEGYPRLGKSQPR